ncbi:tetratricopeptide repeat protein [bacterium]|nr:tetratricopeptide repeat protein [bacterium]
MKGLFILLFCVSLLFLVNCGSPYVEGAKVYIQQGDWPRALEQLKVEVESNPVNGEAYFLMGQVYAEMDSFKKMAVSFDKALKFEPGLEGEIWRWRESKWVKAFNRGVNAGQKGNFEDAIKWTNTAVFIDSTRADAWKNLGYFYGKLEQNEDAKHAYMKAFDIDPTDLEIGMVIVNNLLGEGENDKAMQILDKLEEANPEDVEVLVQKGVMYINDGELDKAAEVLEKAKGLSTKDRAVLFNLGMVYYRQEKYDKAVDNFKGVADLKGDEPDELHIDALLGWGGALYAQKKYEEAEPIFREIISIDENHSGAWEHLGTTLAKLDRTKEGNLAYNHGVGLFKMEEGEWEAAAKYFNDAVKVNPNHLLSWKKLKVVYEKLGEEEKVKEVETKIQELE